MSDDEGRKQATDSWTGFTAPGEIAEATHLTNNQKLELLRRWEQDLRQRMTASREGMPVAKGNLTPETLRAVRASIRRLEQ
jgi:hypothetical protein